MDDEQTASQLKKQIIELYTNENNIIKKVKKLRKNEEYFLRLCILLVLAGIITGIAILIFYRTHTIESVDEITYSSTNYTRWTRGTPLASTVTLYKSRLNKKVYLNIKNSNLPINIIVPKANGLDSSTFIIIYFNNDFNHFDQTFYLFEDDAQSIFVGSRTYFINKTFNKVKITVYNNKWAIVGSGII